MTSSMLKLCFLILTGIGTAGLGGMKIFEGCSGIAAEVAKKKVEEADIASPEIDEVEVEEA